MARGRVLRPYQRQNRSRYMPRPTRLQLQTNALASKCSSCIVDQTATLPVWMRYCRQPFLHVVSHHAGMFWTIALPHVLSYQLCAVQAMAGGGYFVTDCRNGRICDNPL